MMKPVVIVGAGPAGMMLAYQLASNGVPVHVLERPKDCDREFRGEFAQPAVLAPLKQLGILEVLRRTGRLFKTDAHGWRLYNESEYRTDDITVDESP